MVYLHIIVSLQSLNVVQSTALFNYQTHLFHLLDLCRSLKCVCVCSESLVAHMGAYYSNRICNVTTAK